MTDSANDAILDRIEARAHAAEHFAVQLKLLSEIANYGSHLVLRAYNESDKSLVAVIACGVLLKQVVAMIDATQIAIEMGASHAAYLPARAALEASLFIDWMLAADEDFRARSYLVANYRRERLWSNRGIPGTPEHATWNGFSESVGVPMASLGPDVAEQGKAHLDDVNRVLSQPHLKEVDDAFSKRKGKRFHDVEWYAIREDGPQSVRAIAQLVDRLLEYEIYYSRGSSVMHSQSLSSQVTFKSGMVRLKGIRHLANVHEIVNCCVGAAVRSYRSILTRFRPDEVWRLNAKYTNEWKTAANATKHVVYRNSSESESDNQQGVDQWTTVVENISPAKSP